MTSGTSSNGRIMIIGRNGQVGSELMARAGAFGFEAVGFGSVDIDISSASSIAGMVYKCRPDVMINAAAYTAVDKAEHDMEAAFAVNATAPGLMAQVADAAGVPLLHISTDYVYDGHKTGAYVEDDPIRPLSVYGQSKAQGDQAVCELSKQHIILRTSWVFGVHGSNFVKTMMRLAAERPELRVVGDQFGRPTDAGSIADALLRIAQRYVASGKTGSAFPWGIYHFSGQPTVSWHGFAVAIMAELSARGRPVVDVVSIPSEDYPTPAPRPKNSTLDCSKIEREFGIVQSDWQVAMRQLVDVLSDGPKT